jgi:hypothetical protein
MISMSSAASPLPLIARMGYKSIWVPRLVIVSTRLQAARLQAVGLQAVGLQAVGLQAVELQAVELLAAESLPAESLPAPGRLLASLAPQRQIKKPILFIQRLHSSRAVAALAGRRCLFERLALRHRCFGPWHTFCAMFNDADRQTVHGT